MTTLLELLKSKEFIDELKEVFYISWETGEMVTDLDKARELSNRYSALSVYYPSILNNADNSIDIVDSPNILETTIKHSKLFNGLRKAYLNDYLTCIMDGIKIPIIIDVVYKTNISADSDDEVYILDDWDNRLINSIKLPITDNDNFLSSLMTMYDDNEFKSNHVVKMVTHFDKLHMVGFVALVRMHDVKFMSDDIEDSNYSVINLGKGNYPELIDKYIKEVFDGTTYQ